MLFLAGPDQVAGEEGAGELAYDRQTDPALLSPMCPPCPAPPRGPPGWGWATALLLGGGVLGAGAAWAWRRYVR